MYGLPRDLKDRFIAGLILLPILAVLVWIVGCGSVPSNSSRIAPGAGCPPCINVILSLAAVEELEESRRRLCNLDVGPEALAEAAQSFTTSQEDFQALIDQALSGGFGRFKSSQANNSSHCDDPSPGVVVLRELVNQCCESR